MQALSAPWFPSYRVVVDRYLATVLVLRRCDKKFLMSAQRGDERPAVFLVIVLGCTYSCRFGRSPADR